MLSVYRAGLCGGLALLWNIGVSISVQSYSIWHIDALVKSEDEIGK